MHYLLGDRERRLPAFHGRRPRGLGNALSGLPCPFRRHGAGSHLGGRGAAGARPTPGRRRRQRRPAQPDRGLRAHRARRADPCAPRLRDQQRQGRQPRGGRAGAGRADDTVRDAVALQEGHRHAAAPRAPGGAAVGPFRDAVARHREHHAARARCLHHRLAQCARCAAHARPLRIRRLYRAPDPFPGGDGAGRPCGGGVPAVCRRARRRGGDGAKRQRRPAEQHEFDGGPHRHPRQPRPRSTTLPIRNRSNGSSRISSPPCRCAIPAHSGASIQVLFSSRLS